MSVTSAAAGFALLIVASIALGVATLVATRTLNNTMANAVVASSNPLAGLVDFIAVNGDLTIGRDLAREVAAVPGVQSVQAWIWNNARLKIGDERRSVLIVGVDLAQAQQLAGGADDITLSKGTEIAFGLAKLAGKRAAVVGKELADALPAGTKVIELERNRNPYPAQVAGSVAASGNWAMLSGNVVILDQDDAAEVLGYPKGQVNRLDVLLKQGADPPTVRAAIEQVLAGRAHVKTPAEQNQAIGSAMNSFRAGFTLCGVAALVVGMFLVYNALSVTVAERRHEIGILLAVGATRRQVLVLFAGEAALLGLAGALAGIPLGLGLALLGLEPMRGILNNVFANLSVRRPNVSLELILSALAAGIITTVAASLVPAIQASRENPADAVRRVPKAATSRHLVFLFAATLTLLIGGILLTVLRDRLPRQWGTFGGLSLVLVAALVASPLCATLAASALRPVARRYFPIAWRLAAENLLQSPGRTGMVIGALAAGVALVMQTAGVIRSNRASLREWIEESIAADVVITAGSALGSGGHGEPMDAEVADALRSLPEVEAVMELRSPKVEFRGDTVLLLALDAGLAARMHEARIPGGGEVALFRRLDAAPDGALVSENFAARYGVGPGDTITLPSQSGPVTLRVAGTIVDYSWNLGTLYVNRRDYLAHWHDSRADMVDVYVKPGYTPREVKEKIAARFGALRPVPRNAGRVDRPDRPYHRARLRHRVRPADRGDAGGGARRDHVAVDLGPAAPPGNGPVARIGARQTQVIHSVLAEACLMGVLGTALGILFGIPLEWFVLKVVIFEESGFLFPVYIPWDGALLIAAAALTTATLAGLGPAIYAVRQRIPEAIAYE